MANPSPSHNPTDALNTAAIILLTGTGVTAINTGGVSQYKVQLSVSATGFPATTTLTAVLKDLNGPIIGVNGNTFTSGNGNVVNFVSYNNPTLSQLDTTQDPRIASVGLTSGVITALHPGQAVIEAQFATTDENINTNSRLPGMIYSQVLVTVGP